MTGISATSKKALIIHGFPGTTARYTKPCHGIYLLRIEDNEVERVRRTTKKEKITSGEKTS